MAPDNRTREEILESIIKEQVHLAFSKFGKMAMPPRTESDAIERKAIIKSALIFADQEKRKAFNEALDFAAEKAQLKLVDTKMNNSYVDMFYVVDKRSILKLKQ